MVEAEDGATAEDVVNRGVELVQEPRVRSKVPNLRIIVVLYINSMERTHFTV